MDVVCPAKQSIEECKIRKTKLASEHKGKPQHDANHITFVFLNIKASHQLNVRLKSDRGMMGGGFLELGALS